MHHLKALSFSTLAVLFTLIFIGGYVSASGVGLTCPDWPLCPQGLLPHYDFIIEYFQIGCRYNRYAGNCYDGLYTKIKGCPKRYENCFYNSCWRGDWANNPRGNSYS